MKTSHTIRRRQWAEGKFGAFESVARVPTRMEALTYIAEVHNVNPDWEYSVWSGGKRSDVFSPKSSESSEMYRIFRFMTDAQIMRAELVGRDEDTARRMLRNAVRWDADALQILDKGPISDPDRQFNHFLFIGLDPNRSALSEATAEQPE